MGLIFSRFYDKPSTRDTLERIESELQNIEERRWDKIKREQFVVQILSFIPVTILIGIVCILIYPSDSSWRDKLILSIPAVLVNLILLLCRKSVQWYSRWSLDNEEARLRKLQKEKKKILEMVCETESYRVAAELLEKYDPKQLRRRERGAERPSSPLNSTLTKFAATPNKPPQSQATNRSSLSFMNHSVSFPLNTSQLPPVSPAPPPPTPATKPLAKQNQQQTFSESDTTITSPMKVPPTATVAASSVQGRPVRPILSKDRTIFERLVDWVVADGPDNRFALICKYCYGHNGMSLAEEFETINFRCCYCYNLNTTSNRKSQVHDQLQSEREKVDGKISASKAQPDSDKSGKSDSVGTLRPDEDELAPGVASKPISEQSEEANRSRDDGSGQLRKRKDRVKEKDKNDKN